MRIGLPIAIAIITTALFMLVIRSHERYLVDGMVCTIIAAGILPRLRPAAWVLAAGLLINRWFVWGFWHPAWGANISYPDWLYRAMASGNMIGFGLLLWHTWSRQRDVEITGAS